MASISVRTKKQPTHPICEDAALSAKTGQTGFLHLPNEVRNRIYEAVIFNHDKATAYLPRKLPRKVTVDGERTSEVYEAMHSRDEDAPDSLEHMCVKDASIHEECDWCDGEQPPEDVPLPIYTEDFTDDESVVDLLEVSEVNPRPLDRQGLPLSQCYKLSFMRARAEAANNENILHETDKCASCDRVECLCYNHQASEVESPADEDDDDDDNDNEDTTEHSSSSSERMSDWDEHQGLDEDGFFIPPKNCLTGKCARNPDSVCYFCSGFGLEQDQDEEMYVNEDESDKCKDEDPMEDDDEHFDREERMGMLFNTKEPGTPLASKEIRQQCLPVYYGLTAFSCRFFWLEQERSLDRFKEWTHVVGANAKYITRISFEGRHLVEEGIEFEIDIDLLEETPYFNINTDCMHPGDELMDAVVEASIKTSLHCSGRCRDVMVG